MRRVILLTKPQMTLSGDPLSQLPSTSSGYLVWGGSATPLFLRPLDSKANAVRKLIRRRDRPKSNHAFRHRREWDASHATQPQHHLQSIQGVLGARALELKYSATRAQEAELLPWAGPPLSDTVPARPVHPTAHSLAIATALSNRCSLCKQLCRDGNSRRNRQSVVPFLSS